MLGIFLGIAALVSLVSLGQGLQNTINEQFEQLGADKIIIFPKGGLFGLGASGIELTKDDVDAVGKTKGVKEVSQMLYKFVKVEHNGEVFFTFVTGLPLDESRKVMESVQSFRIKEGRNLKNGDKYKALVGIYYIQGRVYDKEVGLRDKLIIEGQEFKIVGVLDTIGNPQDDSQVLIPLETAREIYNEPDRVDAIFAQAQTGTNPSEVADDIEKELRKARNLDEGEEDFSVTSSEQLLETYGTIIVAVQAVVIIVALISLFVGGIGIMNTMYTAVLERTQEIGVMKSIGAKNGQILGLFLVESGTLGLLGGAIGLLIGMGISKSIELATSQAGLIVFTVRFPWYLIIGALLFSFGVGALSGLLPALQASKLKPVDALRYE